MQNLLGFLLRGLRELRGKNQKRLDKEKSDAA
jgi:hypothetical protein